MDTPDYASIMGRSQELVPDWAQQELQRRLGTLQTQNFALANRQAQQQIAANDAATAEEGAFQTAVTGLGENPSADRLRALGSRFPRFAQGVNAAASGIEKQQRQQVTTDLSQFYAALGAGRADLARGIIQRHVDADKAAGKEPDAADTALLGMIDSNDPQQLKSARGFALATLSGIDNEAAKSLVEVNGGTERKGQVVGRAIGHYDESGQWVTDYRDPEAAREVPVYDTNGNRVGTTFVNAEGGDPVSGGGAGGGSAGPARGDVTRLVNSDAGGGYVPNSVQTLGQFVTWGRALNGRGAKSSSAGTYQINGTTMAEFGPKALGTGWRSAPFNADTQERVGEAIFDWAKQQRNPAAALKGRWVSLSSDQAQQLVRGSWAQARGTIAAGETGGGAGASADAGARRGYGGGLTVGPVQGAPKQKDAPSGYRYAADGQSLEPIPGGPADQGRSGGGKALPDAITKRLTPKLDARDALVSALGTFRDDFGGHSLLGDASNGLQSLTGLGAEGQRDWWAQFRSTDNQIRNSLFGASLTDGEKAAYNATTVTPRMAPSEIKRNLKSRITIVNKALARQRNVLNASGYSKDAVGALFGDAPAAPSGSGFRILRVRPK